MSEMRASQLKEDLLALVELGHEQASRILADLKPETLRCIERASRVDWLPVEVDLELVRVIHEAVGDEGLRSWGRAAVARSLKTSLFRPLLDTAVRIFGLSPLALLRAAPQAWKATFRGCGDLKVTEEAPGRVRLVIHDLPPALLDRFFLLSISGSLESVFGACQVQGEVRLVEPTRSAEPAFLATWPSA